MPLDNATASDELPNPMTVGDKVFAALFGLTLLGCCFLMLVAMLREEQRYWNAREEENDGRNVVNDDSDELGVNRRREWIEKTLIIKPWRIPDETVSCRSIHEEDDMKSNRQSIQTDVESQVKDTENGRDVVKVDKTVETDSPEDESSHSTTGTRARLAILASLHALSSIISNASETFEPFSIQEGCAICLVVFEEGDVVCESNNASCRHVFHKDCMIDWLIRHSRCPICREHYLFVETV